MSLQSQIKNMKLLGHLLEDILRLNGGGVYGRKAA